MFGVLFRVKEMNGLSTNRRFASKPTGAFRGRQCQLRLPALLVLAMLAVSASLVCAVSTSAAPPSPLPAFKPATQRAFDAYVLAVDQRNNAELQRGAGLLWIDALPDAERKRAYAALASGQVQIKQRGRSDGGIQMDCPDGMIHHWVGVVFLPGAKLDDVLAILQDYDHHSAYYAPDVVRSRLDWRDGDHFHAFLRFRRSKVITVVLNTEHDVRYFRDSPVLAHSRSSATHIAEVENPGKAGEREKPRDSDGGFLWGMETWWRLEEKDGGVYVQSEIVSLTRDIPAGLGWMIAPFVNAVPRESLSFTLEATRSAVESRARRAAR